jgi:[NiFe] hydrogenase assembly HybE family chaperone
MTAAARAAALEALFRTIAATRMAGVPILHPALQVQAVGFESEPLGRCAVGVLVTPWFMNLVRVPLIAAGAADSDPGAAEEAIAPAGRMRTRQVGNERFDFIGAAEPGFGAYESCSLFSPMSGFVDHAAAVATAQAVLGQLRSPPAADAAAPTSAAAPPSRRALLFGRGADARGEPAR